MAIDQTTWAWGGYGRSDQLQAWEDEVMLIITPKKDPGSTRT